MRSDDDRSDLSTNAELDERVAALGLDGALVESAGWRGGLRDFELRLADGRRILFRDCLQAGYVREIAASAATTIGSWWTDEPSPLLASLGPEVRFSYHHLVFEIGDGVLRVACRDIAAVF